jgi:hypothetical protein
MDDCARTTLATKKVNSFKDYFSKQMMASYDFKLSIHSIFYVRFTKPFFRLKIGRFKGIVSWDFVIRFMVSFDSAIENHDGEARGFQSSKR